MKDRMILHRRALHQIPEIGFELPKTLAYIETQLKGMSCEIVYPAQSSICAYFDRGQSRTVAFRADMDALSVDENTGLPFASTHEGCAHVCGHDGHMAMALGMAEYVNSQPTLPVNVLVVFQPAEETTGGAKGIIDSGIFKKYNVFRIFGCHLWPELPLGAIGSRKGALMAQNTEVDIDIYGKSAHIAKADQGADALYASALFLQRVYHMADTCLPKDVHRLVKFGRSNSGTARNAISSFTKMIGSVRTFDMHSDKLIKDNMACIAKEVSDETNCKVEIIYDVGYPPLINDAVLYDLIYSALGDQITVVDAPSVTCEDFSFYGDAAPSFFFFLGVGGQQPLHSDKFAFDEEALQIGFEFMKKLLYLS